MKDKIIAFIDVFVQTFAILFVIANIAKNYTAILDDTLTTLAVDAVATIMLMLTIRAYMRAAELINRDFAVERFAAFAEIIENNDEDGN